MNLNTNLGRLLLANPITVASGTFALENGEYIDLNRLGAIVTKTITREPRLGNPPPRLVETKGGLLNSIGLQNPGVDAFVHAYLPEYRKLKAPLIVSFSGSSIADFAGLLEQLEHAEGIAGYEINISCPNVEKEGIAFGTDALVVYELTQQLRRRTEKEIIVKLTPNVSNIVEIAVAAQEGGADCLAMINTLLGMAIDWRTGKTLISRGIAGYSGAAVKPVAVGCVYKVAKQIRIPIIGMGGIYNWMDALEFFYAGASAVAVGTSQFIQPTTPIEVLEDLMVYLEESKKDLHGIIGKVWGIQG